MDYLTILPDWQERLAAANLADLDSLLEFSEGKCMSWHLRGKTSLFELPCGQNIFIKQDNYTKYQRIVRSIVRFKRAEPNTERERQCLLLANSYGITVPEVIAWGQRRRGCLPDKGVMVMLPMDGVALDEYVKNEPNIEKRQEAVDKAEKLLKFLQENKLDWKKDCKPEHFFVLNNGEIGLIDLERLQLKKRPLSKKTIKLQLNRFHSLLPAIRE